MITVNEFDMQSAIQEHKPCFHVLSCGIITEGTPLCPYWFYCGDTLETPEDCFCSDPTSHFHPEEIMGMGFKWSPREIIDDDAKTDVSIPDLISCDDDDEEEEEENE